MSFCTNKEWALRGGKTKTIDRIDSAPTLVVDGCFGVELQKQWIDGDRNDVISTSNGKRFVINNNTLLTWEHTNNVSNDIYIDFPDEFGGVKETIQLDKAPLIARWRYRLYYPEGSNLKFVFQPELTQDEINEGVLRPDWCVGSYAIFDKLNRKIGHIPRPYAITSLGEVRWFDISINDNPPLFADIVITGDTNWLKSLSTSAFPVFIDPTLGLTTIGATQHSFWLTNVARAVGSYLAGFSGTLDTAYIYTTSDSSGKSCTLGIYTDNSGSPNSLLGVTPAISVGFGFTGWKSDDYTSPISITSGVSYWEGGNGNRPGGWYDTVGTNMERWYANTYVAGTLVDPFAAAHTLRARQYTVYSVGTESESPPAAFPIQIFIKQKRLIYRR